MSFAQFEREVTAERIRDKLAASKARGMWMGGTPPLGYRPNGRSLAIVEEHAGLVRDIFSLYLELGTVRQLQGALDRSGIVKPVRMSKAGRSHGGTAFSRGELYAILSNTIYIGRIRHRQAEYEGLHEGLIERSLWDLVQAKLADNRNGRQHIRGGVHSSILAGKLFDSAGVKLIASHANKGARRYRYYVSQHLKHGGGVARSEGMRIPAPEIEALVCARLADLFDDAVSLVQRISTSPGPPDVTREAISRAQAISKTLRGSDSATITSLIYEIVQQIAVDPEAVTIDMNYTGVAKSLSLDAPPNPTTRFELRIPTRLKRAGMAMRMIFPAVRAPRPTLTTSLSVRSSPPAVGGNHFSTIQNCASLILPSLMVSPNPG